jgi:hypothetical protein
MEKQKERKIFNKILTHKNLFTASKYEKKVEECLEQIHAE